MFDNISNRVSMMRKGVEYFLPPYFLSHVLEAQKLVKLKKSFELFALAAKQCRKKMTVLQES